MFHEISIPADAKMLFNIVKLKPEYTIDDVEMTLGEMCNVVKNTYGDEEGGFIAGQVFVYDGFISQEGSVGEHGEEGEHIAIVTYWKSFDQHEKSHADKTFLDKFNELGEMCVETKELGYSLLWQGVPEK